MNSKLIIAIVVGVAAIGLALAFATSGASVNKNIAGDELVQLQADGARLVDVRTPGEYEAGHIAAAVNIPVDQIQQGSASWDKSTPVVVYCATGSRSADAAAYLAGAGFKKVYNLTQGVVAWKGELVGGQAAGEAPTGGGTIKTDGKPIFIEFSTST